MARRKKLREMMVATVLWVVQRSDRDYGVNCVKLIVNEKVRLRRSIVDYIADSVSAIPSNLMCRNRFHFSY